MKKHLLLLVFVLAVSVVQAQEMYSFMYSDTTGYFYTITNSIQQRDGDHVIDIYLAEDVGNYESVPLGHMFYKISPTALVVTDSLFVADTIGYGILWARNPWGEGNIRAAFEYHGDCDSSFVRISHFPDDNLHANPDEDVLVPVCQGVATNGIYVSLLDCKDDLIMLYYKALTDESANQHIARIGLDGTLKQQALLTENLIFNNLSPTGTLRLLKESPLQYYQWNVADDYPNDNLAVYVIDSVFHKNVVILNKMLKSEIVNPNTTIREYLNIGYETEVVPAEGDNILVAAKYTHDTNFYATTQDYGVAVAKYDLRTMQLKGYAVFNDNHAYYSTGYPMGLKMMRDGTVYFMYKEHGCYPEESVIIVKMDTDLNVEWKRFCKTGRVSMSSPLESPLVFEDEAGEEKGVTWCGYAIKDGNYNKLGWVYFMLNHDGTVNAAGEGIEVRPYAFYPNPVQSELHLSYSPDVQPARIELYDLQGRLLKTRTQGLESIGLEGLAAGQYLMKVTLQDGKEFTDKVVKE